MWSVFCNTESTLDHISSVPLESAPVNSPPTSEKHAKYVPLSPMKISSPLTFRPVSRTRVHGHGYALAFAAEAAAPGVFSFASEQ